MKAESTVKAEASHGLVLVRAEDQRYTIEVEDALTLMEELASAVQHAGDIGEPKRVFLREAVAQAVADFRGSK